MLGSILSVSHGAYSLQFGTAGTPQYRSKHFSVARWGSSAKAKAAALAYQKEIQPELEKLTIKLGKSKFDKIFSTNKKFRDFVSKIVKTDPVYKNFKWEETKGNPENVKSTLHKRFENELKFPKKANYNLVSKELAKTLGLSENYFDKVALGQPRGDTQLLYIKKNFPRIQAIEDGRLINFWKTTPTKIAEFKKLFTGDLKGIATDTAKRVLEIDDVFREAIVIDKRLPTVFEVIAETSANTPSKAASAMAVYSKALRGEEFRQNLKIRPAETAGKRLITQLGDSSKRNSYTTAFYKLALDNVNKGFNKQGTLGDFRRAFRTELRAAMQLKEGVPIPYNINEVISLSAGESRGIRPFSVFVDGTLAKINQENLATYQGVFSDKVAEVEDLIKRNKLPEAEKAAAT